MDIELIEKINELLAIFENSDEIKKMEILKKEIFKNKKIKEKLDKYNKIKDNVYSSELINLKKEILDIEEIKEYKKLENDLLLLTFSINQKMNRLVNAKGCKNENN